MTIVISSFSLALRLLVGFHQRYHFCYILFMLHRFHVFKQQPAQQLQLEVSEGAVYIRFVYIFAGAALRFCAGRSSYGWG